MIVCYKADIILINL